MVNKCNICPRACDVDRNGSRGFCGEGDSIRLARAAAHYWEEPCISGDNGSGAVFFSGCNLHCVFCQNREISRSGIGKAVTVEQLAHIFLRLQSEGVHNINLVTPTHFSDKIKKALLYAKSEGLVLPIVWNSSGYENTESIRELKGIVDIYMPDFKYVSADLSNRYSKAADYFEVAKKALDEMVIQRGAPVFKDGLMTEGVIVRHLALPGCVEDSKAVLRFLRRRYGNAIYISIMKQYTPPDFEMPDELGRKLYDEEYEELCEYSRKLGIIQGFTQEGECVGESFIPKFNLEGVE